jgi:Pyruvate/2-oxoacid:ferredoxin oxidoreductase delta subunit
MEKKKIESVKQLPIMPLTIEDMTWNKTGTWRLLTPKGGAKTAPCRAACPIGQPIPEFIHAVSVRNWDRALELLLEVNPLPGVTGRLCYHPCRGRCLRKELEGSVPTRELEKAVADLGKSPEAANEAKGGKKLAVCGAGPAGLTASYHLALRGCQVTVFDPSDRAGGFLKAVKADKLPPEVLAREISRLVAISGVQLQMKAVGLNSEEYDLTIIDRTAYQPGSEEARAVEALVSGEGQRLDIQTEKGAPGFKAVQVAHAVALGRRIAFEACTRLGLSSDQIKENPEQVVSKEDLKFHRFLADVPATPAVDAADEQAVLEAKRCMSCGTCNLCQSCVLACPDACCRLDEGQGTIVFDLDHCKGCGICAYECPRGVLVMENLP